MCKDGGGKNETNKRPIKQTKKEIKRWGKCPGGRRICIMKVVIKST